MDGYGPKLFDSWFDQNEDVNPINSARWPNIRYELQVTFVFHTQSLTLTKILLTIEAAEYKWWRPTSLKNQQHITNSPPRCRTTTPTPLLGQRWIDDRSHSVTNYIYEQKLNIFLKHLADERHHIYMGQKNLVGSNFDIKPVWWIKSTAHNYYDITLRGTFIPKSNVSYSVGLQKPHMSTLVHSCGKQFFCTIA